MAAFTLDDLAEEVPLGDVTQLVTLERLDQLLFRTRFSAFEQNDHLYGGQVLAQALAAASLTVESREAHSLHGYFLRAGSARRHVTLEVERTRDGGRFSTRRVVATQDTVPIFHMECSFHDGERGLAYERKCLGAAAPEDLPTLSQTADLLEGRISQNFAEQLRQPRLIELRLTDPEQLTHVDPAARRRFWLRLPGAGARDDPFVHRCLLAYLSDFWLAGSALVPHSVRASGPDMFIASLDHALWLHRPHRADEWLLYDCDTPWSGDGRGLARGLLYNRDGSLIASVAQEALLRMR